MTVTKYPVLSLFQNTVIVLIDCGGNLNISEVLEPLPDSQVFVLDSHTPYDLDNVYDGQSVKMVIPETFDLEVCYIIPTVVYNNH